MEAIIGKVRWKNIILVLICLVVYAVVLEKLGFMISTIFFIGVVLRVIEKKRWSLVVVVSISATLVFWVIFQYWLQGGRIDVGFLGAAQIDKFGNINTTVIGEYHRPGVRLPGAGGAPEIAGSARQVFLMLKQSARTFVPTLDFITSVGYLDGGDARAKLGLPGKGPVVIITDLCTLEPEPPSNEFVVTQIHPGVTREQIVAATGWPIRFAADVRETPPPTDEELWALRDLQQRTLAAQGESSSKE